MNELPALSGPNLVLYPENGTGTVATYTAVDPESDELTWTLTGPDASRFSLDASGVLSFKTPPDYENPTDAGADNLYNLTVNVSDGKAASGAADTGVDASINLAVTVLDVNEPLILRGVGSAPYSENATGPVATYTAVDPESDALTWTLTGPDAGRFSLDHSGVLTFRTPPDYENPADAGADNVYNLTVNVSDGKAADGSADPTIDNSITVVVTVTDVEEPLFIRGDSTILFLFGSPGTSAIAHYSVADAPQDSLSWTLSGPDAGLFNISGAGALSFREAPDLDNPADQGQDNVYNLTVNVADGKGGSGRLDVTIKMVSAG